MNHFFRIIWSKALGTWVVAPESAARCGKSRGRKARRLPKLAGVGASVLAVCGWSSWAGAQVWTGATSNNWTVGTNWSTGTAPNGTGTVTINTSSANPAVMGVSGATSATIGNLQINTLAGTTGSLTIQNGSTLSSSVATGTNYIGQAADATVTVTGAGSSWSTAAATILGGSGTATGTLNIANGANVSLRNLSLGQGGVPSSGTLNVTGGGTLNSGAATLTQIGSSHSSANISGAGSQWSVSGALTIGRGPVAASTGSALLNVANGAVVTATGIIWIGGPSLSTSGAGVATVTDAGSQLNTSAALNIGAWGQGTLTVSNGAVATANTVTLGGGSSGRGTLNVSSGGTLATQALTGGPGLLRQANFDGATLRATNSSSSFVSGFTGTELNIAAGGLVLDTAAFSVAAASPFSGTGALTKTGTGTAVLSGNSTYTGGTTIAAGTLQLGNGGTSGSIAGDVVNNGTLAFNRSDNTIFAGAISGNGSVAQAGPGTTALTGTNTYSGATAVQAGTLLVNGNQAAATGLTTVQSGATLGGTGTLGGAVNIASGGTLSPGDNVAVGALTVNGNLSVDNGASLNYQFGQANTPGGPLNDLTTVTGNLALGGTLNVSTSPGGSFGAGVYRIFDYGGTLTNQGLSIGSAPAGTYYVQTSVANQVNLVNSTGLVLNFWNGGAGARNSGTIQGGNGTWQSQSGNDNWADSTGKVSAPYMNGAFAVFEGAPGTVTVDNSLGNVTASGMQFAANGYTLTGNALTLTGTSNLVRVGDGTAAGAGMTATIDVALAGSGGLQKADLGTLVLNGNNSYTDGTNIQAGTLRVSRDANLGAADGALTIGDGTLQTTASMTSARSVSLSGAAGLLTGAGTTLTLTGLLAGSGSLTKAGAGTLVLQGADTHTGETRISAGTLTTGAAQLLSAASSYTVAREAMLDLNGFSQTVGTLTNAGMVSLNGSGNTALTVAGNFTGAGGAVRLHTALGGDASMTDRLVVQGDTAGTATLKVTNVGGTGDRTVNGIKIVDVVGQSSGTFALQGDYAINGQQAVIGGAYAYTLHKNGVSTPGDGDWYLRSTLLDETTTSSPAAAGPLYQPGAPLYEAYPQVLLALNGLPTLQQRVGDRYWNDTEFAAPAVADPTAGGMAARRSMGWARVEGRHLGVDGVHSTTGARWNLNDVKTQAGFDAQLLDHAAGRLFAGVGMQYGYGHAGVSSFFGNGRIRVDGYSLTGTTTWSGSNGFYVDGQAQATWYDSNLSSDQLGRRLVGDNKGFGHAFSIESGQRMALTGAWTVTPQAQLVYSAVTFDGFTDPFGARVNRDKADSLTARLGVSLDYNTSWRDAAGHAARGRFYGLTNLYYDFRGDTTVNVNDTLLSARADRMWAGIGVGGALSWNDDRLGIYGELMARSSLEGSGHGHDYRANVGARLRW
ncbi:autotransporter outer membrane beta-barrel domain-containing protein [Cupriavidus nantongensis]|uniref:autotransporter outer membrane beta-barrel domain-containing protein n=1 Tax=Cupriavidus nantongensis TaxID=1796606 RepID=UPI002245FCE8|nr:autotransporter outer membrane beta-barrel domain-containing protein [Cupriavidus nantongensis]